MTSAAWLLGLCRRRSVEVAAAALSLAVAVAFMAALGSFVNESRSALTRRAAAQISVDWQVQVTARGNAAEVRAALQTTPGLRRILPVELARVASLSSTTATGSRTTGQAYIVALPPGYAKAAPGQIRYLLGAQSGILLQQQTAANLAAGTGSTVSVTLPSGGVRSFRVDGVADLPQADSFFQAVGSPPGAGATAPPDNVVLVDPVRFKELTRGGSVITQFHVLLDHSSLPADPAAAANAVTRRVNHFSAQVAGGALVGDNLGAKLSAAREDALYAQLLFLLLGIPGLVLAGIVASLVVALSGERKRREVALLRLRGATPSRLLWIVASETILTGLLGAAVGVPLALLACREALPPGTHLTSGWTIAAGLMGLALAVVTQLGPAARAAWRPSGEEIAGAVARVQPIGLPWPLKLGLDALLLAGSLIVFYLTAKNGYQIVVVPEGVPVASVNYAALLAPALGWPGLTLLIWRLNLFALGRRTGRFARSTAGRAPELAAAAIRRRRRVIARGAAGLSVALGLAASTAIFTATYDKQAKLDVALTVGADVALTEPEGASVSPSGAATLLRVKGVTAVEPLQHRLVYVGSDLQDLYGIDPASIRRVAPLLDSFVPGSTIKTALKALQTTPNGALLSAETIKDYQLHPGDPIRLRLQSGPGHTYQLVEFRVVGVVKEFPTAPKDSFIVTNAAFISKVTGSDAVASFLIRSTTPTATASALKTTLAAGAQIHDINTDRNAVPSASGLASADLSGISRLELGFGVILALACSGLALALGITERRRALVLLAALGASARQRSRFISAEARALIVGGIIGGAVIGTFVAYLLVKVLSGIFDPAPTGLTIPLTYLGSVFAGVIAASGTVVAVVSRVASRAGPKQLRDL